MPRISYFICCTMRSGSYLLAEALTNTGLAGKPGEHITGLLEPWHEDFELDDYRSALRGVLERGTADRIFGTKVMWPWFGDFVGKLQHLANRDARSLAELIAEIFPNPHYISLTRRDKLRQTISLGRAVWTNVWRSTESENQKGRVEDLRIDPRVVDHEMRVIRDLEASFDRFFTQEGIQPHRVVYEELVDGYEQTALEILDFLRINRPRTVTFRPRLLQRQWDDASDALLRQYYAAKGIEPISRRGH